MSARLLVVATAVDRYPRSGKPTGLWLGELSHFWQVVRAAGYEVDVVTPTGGAVPVDPVSTGPLGGAAAANRELHAHPDGPRLLERALAPADVDDAGYAAIYLAGGHGAMFDLPGDPALVALTGRFAATGRPVSAVCHGVAGLLEVRRPDGAALVAGRRVTGYATVEEYPIGRIGEIPFRLQDELIARGGRYRRSAVPFVPHVEVADGLITGQNPLSAKGVARALVTELRGR